MGEDLITACVIFKSRTNFKKSEQAMLKMVDKLTDKELSSFQKDILEEDDQFLQFNDLKTIMKETITDLFECLEYRDVTWFKHKGDIIYIIYITGGMSWGDAPTDSFTTFSDFHRLPQKVLHAGGVIV